MCSVGNAGQEEKKKTEESFSLCFQTRASVYVCMMKTGRVAVSPARREEMLKGNKRGMGHKRRKKN